MKRLLFLFGICTFATFSCSKKNEITKTFRGDLLIVSTNSPKTAIIGQNIISNVRCQLSSLSGNVIFQGFDIKEVSLRHYKINAKALYKDWNTQVGMPVMWILDTTATINTTTTGKYILAFYNSAQLFKIDTVQVN